MAFNGAEPIRADTLERFCQTFAECGFRPQAFYPCYGMAEATLMVSGGRKAALPVIKTIQNDALECDRIVEARGENEDIYTLVGCGQALPDQEIVIVHPETRTRCRPDEVGEIWVSGSSVGHGYWNRPEETQQIFQAELSDTENKRFLRTGDLGFLHEGELFITDRAKDLIIIRGRNLYPQDIELSAERSHPALRLSSGAAFAVEVGHIDVVPDETRLTCEDLLATSPEARQSLLNAYLQQQVAQVLRVAPSQIDFQQPINTLGIDSLMGLKRK